MAKGQFKHVIPDTNPKTNQYLGYIELDPLLNSICKDYCPHTSKVWDWDEIEQRVRTEAKRRGFEDRVVDAFFADKD